MIHPHTRLEHINAQIGSGVFATAFIPKGTIVYIKDDLEIVISQHSHLINHPSYRRLIEHYSYTEPDGSRVISWDIAKYVNHACNCNTLSTGYGFEIAIRDINQGEQITDDYGALNIERSMHCSCGDYNCRKTITPDDIVLYAKQWDPLLKSALARTYEVEQPLMHLMDPITRIQLNQYLSNQSGYRSIRLLRHEKSEASVPSLDSAIAEQELAMAPGSL